MTKEGLLFLVIGWGLVFGVIAGAVWAGLDLQSKVRRNTRAVTEWERALECRVREAIAKKGAVRGSNSKPLVR